MWHQGQERGRKRQYGNDDGDGEREDDDRDEGRGELMKWYYCNISINTG